MRDTFARCFLLVHYTQNYTITQNEKKKRKTSAIEESSRNSRRNFYRKTGRELWSPSKHVFFSYASSVATEQSDYKTCNE